MKKIVVPFSVFACLSILSCQSSATVPPATVDKKDTTAIQVQAKDTTVAAKNTTLLTAEQTLALPEVPVLCYHQIREWKPNETRLGKDVVVPPAMFRSQLQALADSGYQTILPDQLYDYLTKGTPLPPKPIMLTYDDGDVDQYNIAAPEMKKHGFKGVYFVMTISLGRSIYMSKAQVKELSDAGHVIASHTWSHQNFKKNTGAGWDTEITRCSQQLQEITGKPIEFLAYPFGVWTQEGIPELKKRNIKAAFQLSTKRDSTEPLYTIRRMIVPGDWGPAAMIRAMKKTFRM